MALREGGLRAKGLPPKGLFAGKSKRPKGNPCQPKNHIIKSGISKPQLNIHAWLTLPTCEILDFTLPTTYAVINKTKEGYGEVLAGHADHLLENVRYRPMLLGEDYLRRIGALLEF